MWNIIASNRILDKKNEAGILLGTSGRLRKNKRTNL